MGAFEDFVHKHDAEQATKPQVEPSADQLAFTAEYRALYLGLVRSGFTKSEAQSHMIPYIMAWFGKNHRDPDKPWERE